MVGNGEGVLLSRDSGRTWGEYTLTTPQNYYDIEKVELIDSVTALAVIQFGEYEIGSVVRIKLPQKLNVEFGERQVYGTHIFPNPARHSINVFTTYSFDGKVTVIDPFGRNMLEGEISPKPGTSEIDCSSLESGAYQILIKYRGRTLSIGRFVLLKD
jgi:hypothetical protein